jgi:hypothetical protein
MTHRVKAKAKAARRKARPRAAAPGPQLYQLAEAVPTDPDLFRAAIFAAQGARGKTWPRAGGVFEARCSNPACLIGTIRIEVAPAPSTWAKVPALWCPSCGDALTCTRRLQVVVLLPTTAGGQRPC